MMGLGSGVNVVFASGKEAWEVEKAARGADVALVFASLRSGEGWDRENLKIGWGQVGRQWLNRSFNKKR